MTEPNPRRRWTIVAAAAAAVLLLIVLVVAIAGGGDGDGEAAGGTTVPTDATTAPAAPGTSAPTGAATTSPTATTAPDAATPTTAPDDDAPTTSAAGAGGDDGGDAGSETGDGDPGAPAPTTAPSPGSLVTVPTGTIEVADPIPPDEVGEFGTGVTAEIVTVEAVEGIAQSPGEVSGPALRVRVRIANGTDSAINLSRVLVDVTYGPDRTPGLALAEPGGEPFIGELAAGRSAEGVYVFGVPVAERGQVQINVSYDVTAPILVFEGPAPRA